MRDRSMRSGTKLAREIQLTDWSTAGNLSNRSSGVQIPRDVCTRFGRYLYSARCSWIISSKTLRRYISMSKMTTKYMNHGNNRDNGAALIMNFTNKLGRAVRTVKYLRDWSKQLYSNRTHL